MDDLRALDRAGVALEQRLSALRPGHLEQPSACSGWSVYDLVNHVSGGGHRYLLLLQGAAAADLAATRTLDHVRPDAVVAYRRWQQPLATAFAEPGALERTVHHPVGDRSGLELLRMRTLDLTLHAWDLARSLDLNETLDAELSAQLLDTGLGLVDELRGQGLYAPAGEKAEGPSSPQRELLRLTGRA